LVETQLHFSKKSNLLPQQQHRTTIAKYDKFVPPNQAKQLARCEEQSSRKNEEPLEYANACA